MHMHSLAPGLSATSRYVYIWIMAIALFLNPLACASGLGAAGCDRRRSCLILGAPRRGLGHHAEQQPVLGLAERPALHDLDGVAGVRDVLLVVDVADRPAADVLAVARVLDQPRDLDAAGLVHLFTGDHAHGGPPPAVRRRGGRLGHFFFVPWLACC